MYTHNYARGVEFPKNLWNEVMMVVATGSADAKTLRAQPLDEITSSLDQVPGTGPTTGTKTGPWLATTENRQVMTWKQKVNLYYTAIPYSRKRATQFN